MIKRLLAACSTITIGTFIIGTVTGTAAILGISVGAGLVCIGLCIINEFNQ
jgi:hypothetical protein